MAKISLSDEDAKFITGKHLELWNERDPGRRHEIMRAIYAPDIEMVDRHFIAAGHEQVESFISGLHAKNSDRRFTHTKPIDFHHHIIRLYWEEGLAVKPNAVTGMDLFVIENGKVQKLYVFVDADQ
jgi:hypothetical protein